MLWNQNPEYATSLEWTFVEDQGILKGHQEISFLRTDSFWKWGAEAIKIEHRHCTGDLSRYFRRYKCFIQVDEDALRSVVYEAPPPPKCDMRVS